MAEASALERPREDDGGVEENVLLDFTGSPIRIVADPSMDKYFNYFVRQVDATQLQEFQQIVDSKLERGFIVKAPEDTAGGFVENLEVRDDRGVIAALTLTAMKMSEDFYEDKVGQMMHAQYFFGRSGLAPAYAVKNVKTSRHLLRSPLLGGQHLRAPGPMEIYSRDSKMTGRCVMVPYGKRDDWGRQGLFVGATASTFRFHGTPPERQKVLTARY